ncbi:cellulase family glycosylhydrolase [Priestia megaterium]|uniref:cellulase family glycosylhydrolase n=1 Tax=Priestia megaterium TaxID=1404 RepID=UPI002E227F8E|nr:cellulase family glycosylhydrolase [Priestia megaterium]MED4063767.1 cellulase family glycosylhydrolase [Priestia megaterium]
MTVPDTLGVNVHMGTTKQDVKMIDQAGFKWVRFDLNWSNVESKKGVYNFDAYDKLNRSLGKHGIKPYYILDYSNKLYENDNSVVTPEGRRAFKNFAKEAAQRYKDQGAVWEIWNEPNSNKFWSPQPSFEEYSRLVNEVAPAIKRADKSGKIVAPALNGINEDSLKWLEEIFKKGILKNIDMVSVHPYRNHLPETVLNDYTKVRELIKKYSSNDIQIVSGEWGYVTEKTSNRRDGELKQAEYATRMMLINSWMRIPISVWYGIKNDGQNINVPGENYGLVWPDNEPKIAYRSIRVLSHTTKGYHVEKRLEYGYPEDYIIQMTNSNNKKMLVFWTTEKEHYLTISFPNGNGRLISMLGESQKVKWNQKQIVLKLTSSPSYLLIE